MDDEEFRRVFDENLENRDTLDLDTDPEEEILGELGDLEIGYDEVLVQTFTGKSYRYSPGKDSYEEISPELQDRRPKELLMEYTDSWKRVDLSEPISGAEAYMFHLH